MRDHAAIVPTSAGPVGAIVSEPEGALHGALILLQGGGEPCRAGVNAGWARFSRDLAERGIAVLRFDFAGEGDSTMAGEEVPRVAGWRRDTDLAILREMAAWFRERIGLTELLIAGSCHGGRIALEFASEDPNTKGTFLIVPYLWNLPPSLLSHKLVQQAPLPRASELFDQGSSDIQTQQKTVGEVEAVTDREPLDDSIAEHCRRALKNGPVWILTGEGDSQKPAELMGRLGSYENRLDVEVIPGMIIHPVTSPEVQEIVKDHLMGRLAEHVQPCGECAS